jgi:hypothetical protein
MRWISYIGGGKLVFNGQWESLALNSNSLSFSWDQLKGLFVHFSDNLVFYAPPSPAKKI